MEDNKDKGIVWVPYTIKTVSTSINGETVWYANKWKNLLLKIKHFFIKPKYLKNTHIYKNKPVNPSLYREIKIDGGMISINDMREILNQLEKDGANYVRVGYHCDHNEVEIDGANWQAERMFNEEDLRNAYFSAIKTTGEGWNGEYAEGNSPNIEEKFNEEFEEWLKQFKKK